MPKRKKPCKSGSNVIQKSTSKALLQYLRTHKIPVAIWAAIITAAATVVNNVFFSRGAGPEQTISAPIVNDGDGIQVVANGSVEVSYNSTRFTQQQIDQAVEEQKVSRKLAERLLKNLEEKDIVIADQQAKLQVALEQSAQLKARLNAKDDQLSFDVELLLEQGKIEDAEKLLSASLSNRMLDIETQKVAAASEAFELGAIKHMLLEYSEAREYFEKAVELDPSNTDYLVNLANIETFLDKFDSAESHLMQALSLTKQRFGEGSMESGDVLNYLGNLFFMQSNPVKAIPIFEEVLSICMAAGNDNTYCALSKNNLASALRLAGEDGRASDLMEDVWPNLLNEYANDPSGMAFLLNNIAYAEDDCVVAMDLLRKAEDHFLKSGNRAGSLYANILENQSECLIFTGRTSEAIVKLNSALRIYQDQLGSESSKVAMVFLELGRAWHVIPNFNNAIDYYLKAYNLFKKVLGDEHPDTIIALDLLKNARLGTRMSVVRLKK